MRYLYVIKSGENHYKIGIAIDPTKRLKELQTGNGHRLNLICTRLFDDAEKVEIMLHSKLNSYLAKGGTEWFELSPEQVIKVLKMIHEIEDVRIIDELIMLNKIVDSSNKVNAQVRDYITKRSTAKSQVSVKIPAPLSYASKSEDELVELAKIVFTEAGKGSTSLLQRKLRIGYSKASRIVDLLTKTGFLQQSNEPYLPHKVI